MPKKFGDNQGNRIYLLKIILVFLIICTFFTVIFAINCIMLNQINIINDIYNTTSIGYSNYSGTVNILREKFINLNMPYFGNNSMNVFNSSLEMTIDINNQILFV